MKRLTLILSFLLVFSIEYTYAIDTRNITFEQLTAERFTLIDNGQPTSILFDKDEIPGVVIAINNLQKDFQRVSGNKPLLLNDIKFRRAIIVGSLNSIYIKKLIKAKKIDGNQLKGKNEKYIMTVVSNPLKDIDEALVIAGSDKRGTIYGIYELSEQIGVSPWYDWADVPVVKHKNLSIKHGLYTAGEPAVKYRGIFLNDEAPCLTSWVKNTYGDNFGGHKFYARVFELILRLRGNFMWPAMWSWSFYADDPENSKTADEMGIVMGTSHHEPMASNHQEWVVNRKKYGDWDYSTNKEVLDKFFSEGVKRVADKEDLITIGMRGDGDVALGGKEGHDDEYVNQDEKNMKLLTNIIESQRKIIKDVTKKAPEKREQVWALYKEVQRFYDMGLKVPDDVIILLSDDNWGDVRRLPNAQERKRKGGWGMYYHVDYVGAPRNTKWLNVTPIQNIWEQLNLTYEYGVDKLWVLNVGDLKPMEYPISLFMDMAWSPNRYSVDNILDHTYNFCAQQFGEDNAKEAAHLINMYSKYNGRVTPEMLDCNTYNINTGEWKQVSDEYCKLEAEALRLFIKIKPEYRDAYRELILFPVQAMSNLYEMYYSQAMNHKLYEENNPQANYWADKVEEKFNRDAQLCKSYNHNIANGKWNGMMTQKHIGYTSWNDDFPADVMPKTYRIDNENLGGYIFTSDKGVVSIEAEHYYKSTAPKGTKWEIIPYMGRTLSGVALRPYINDTEGASLSYKMKLPKNLDSVSVHVIVKSTLAFKNNKGHSYSVGFEGGESQTINYNSNLNEEPENVYSIYYPTVATRIVEKTIKLSIPHNEDGVQILNIKPFEPGIVFEKIIIDFGGYKKCFLYMNESSCKREKI